VTPDELDGLPPARGGGRRRLAGATLGMAVGTTLSRITGLGRTVALAVALGGGGFADGYNLANNTPNMVVDLVLTGVLSATFVPVFVDHLSTRRGKEAWEAISAVVTVTIVVLVVATIAFFFLTPEIIHLYPQLACYGLIALFAALLNARGKFAAPMFVPIANNLVVIGVLLWFHALVPHPSLASLDAHHTGLVLLGIGTTLGVVVQAVLLIPSLARADLHIRFLWDPVNEAMRTITRLAGWTFGWVVANQIALFVMLALADGTSTPGGVSAWTYAYMFFQLPYGIVAVSVMTAVTPSLSARWARHDVAAFRHRMTYGLRATLAIIIPSAVGMVLLARPLIDLVLDHGAETSGQAATTAATLALFALGLPGFCTYLFMVRVLQSMQDTRTAFRLYLVENGINIVVGLALVGTLGVRGLALSLSIAYSVTALVALAVIRRRVGGLGGADLATPVKRILAATCVMAVTTVLALSVSGATTGVALLGRVVLAVVVGAVTYIVAAGVLGTRLAHRSERPPRPPGREPFRDRLDDVAGPQVRRLRPVSTGPEDEVGPGGDGRPGDDKEDFDGPHPRGD
jgi:putative peptidoglycan lipid II flippase